MNEPHPKKNGKGAYRGRLYIISAPSGTGKTTLCKIIRNHFKDLKYSISYTTRAPRKGEQTGIDYHFVDEKYFKKMIVDDDWAEWARVHGHYYGTSAGDIDNWLADGYDVLLDIDVQGALQIMERYPDCVSIFIMPPSKQSLQTRLEKRGTDTPDVIQKRMAQADTEMAQKSRYRYIVVNDSLNVAVEELVDIFKKFSDMPAS